MEIIVSFFLTLVFLSVGKFFIEKIKIDLSSMEKIAVSFGAGLGLVGYVVFIMGLLHLLYKPLVAALLCVLLILNRRQLWDFISIFRRWFAGAAYKQWDRFSLFLLCAIFFQLAISLLYDLGPVIGWDAPAYYLYLPKIYAQNHGIIYLPSHILAGGPQLIEMIYTVSMLLSNGIAAVLMNWWIGVFIMLAAYVFSRKILSRNMALTVVAILCYLPEFNYYFGEGKPTLGTHFFGIICVMMFIAYIANKDIKYVLLSAVFGGFAMASSGFSGFVIVTMLAIWVIIALIKRSDTPLYFKHLFIFLVITVLIGGPFYIRNIVLTGNPVFPFCYNLFGGKYWNENLRQFWQEVFPRRSLNIFSFMKFLFWDYTFSLDSPIINGRMTTPLFLIFIPLLLLMKNLPGIIKKIAFFSLLYFVVFYFLSGPQRRYSIVIFPFLSLLTVYAMSRLNDINKVYRFLFCVSLSAFVIYGAVISVRCFAPRAKVVFKAESQDSYLSRYYNDYEVLKFINANTPKASTVLLIGSYGYYCDRDTIRGDYPQGFIAYDSLNTPEKLISRFKQEKINYIAVNYGSGSSAEKYYRIPYDMIAGIRKPYLDLVYSKNKVDLYKIKYN